MKNVLLRFVFCLSTVFLDSSFASHSGAKTAINSSYCFWTRDTSEGLTHYTFLHQTEDSYKSPILYHSVWASDSSLLNCVLSDDPSVSGTYMSKCTGSNGNAFSETPDKRFNISKLFEPGNPCMSAPIGGSNVPVRNSRHRRSVDFERPAHRSPAESSGVKSRRVKRSWMIPGTLWCGSGNEAASYFDLGVFEKTDMCCREHDHCKDTIGSFEYKHGVFNTNIFTLSHCDCDERFHRCLLGAEDGMSDVVGYGYFNVLQMQCFEFSYRMECSRRTWYGMCAFYEMTKYAVVKDPTDYNSTVQGSTEAELQITINQLNITEDHNEISVSATSPATRIEDVRKANEFTTTSKPLWTSNATLTHSSTTQRTETTHTPETHLQKPEQDSTQRAGELEVCGVYKELDTCRFQIPALQERFGLRNNELKTLYHCNCTTRLAEKLSEHASDDAKDLHSHLLDFVSNHCFTLHQSGNCTESQSCPAALTKATALQRWAKDMIAGRHLEDSMKKIGRLNTRRSKRKDKSVKLYKKCRRIHSKLQKTKRL
ncbi:group 3 secretory phospholipase A2 [Chanos chanos]|uniref:phospholipase A2 n=1 Tax=Chanos chanos TaxID=29144 RepID=A0A6J2V0R1_CHACN|nr:group 3 secretory phospholipase A2-like [Chanos chanos]